VTSPSSSGPKQRPRTTAEIEQDLVATRARLTSTLDELSVRMQPDQLGKEVSDVARSAVDDQVGRFKAWAGLPDSSDPHRQLNPAFAGAVAGAGLAVVILLVRARRSR
jgi:hypothetical protein